MEFTINELEFYCDNKNTTLLKVKKKWLSEVLQKSSLKNVLLHLTNKVFESDKFYKKQKIIALINLVKSVRKECNAESNLYQLNLVVRNLNIYTKSGEYVKNEDLTIVLYSLITLAFSNSYNKILKNLYDVKA